MLQSAGIPGGSKTPEYLVTIDSQRASYHEVDATSPAAHVSASISTLMCCWLNQHKPSLTPLAHITLNLLDTTQFNPSYRFRGQGMKHVCATMLTTVHLHRTGLPIYARIGGLQPVYSQHNVMVQLRQNLAIDSAMQRLTVPRAYNQRYTTRQ